MKYKILILKCLVILAFLGFMNSCQYDQYLPETEPIDTTVVVSFSEEIIPIFNESCNNSSCHAPGAIAPDLTPANAYSALINGNYINTDIPEESELYQWMIGNGDLPMPLTGPNSAYNTLVLTWITQGALDN